MNIFPMKRIRLWAKETGREISKVDGKFKLESKQGIKIPAVDRPRFRRLCSMIMLKEGHY